MAACLKLIFKTVFHATSAFIFQFSSVIQCQFSIFSVQKFNKTCYFYSNSVNFHYSLKLLPGRFEKYAWKKEPVRRTGSYRHEKHCYKHSGCIFCCEVVLRHLVCDSVWFFVRHWTSKERKHLWRILWRQSSKSNIQPYCLTVWSISAAVRWPQWTYYYNRITYKQLLQRLYCCHDTTNVCIQIYN